MHKNTKAILAITAGLVASGAMIAMGGPEGDHSHAKPATAKAAKAKIGEKAPDFTLGDLDGKEYTLATYLADDKVNAVVLEWFNPECPVVVDHYRRGTMGTLQKQFEANGIAWLRINSGAEGKQGAAIPTNASAVSDWEISGPVLLDRTGTVGKAYGAKTTPHMYVLDSEGVLRYAGAIDDNMRNPTVNYVEAALKSVLAGETVETAETKAYGCGVKYAN